MRLIDAEAFEKSVRTDFWEHYTDCHDTYQTDLLELIMDNLAEQPTVEAKPVVHAHWLEQIIDGSQELMCSNCGEYALMNDEFYSEFSKYCPYCGAQMDEKED